MSSIYLSWQQTGYTTGFDIYRSTTSIDVNNLPAPIATGITHPYYVDSTVQDNTVYHYRISTRKGSLSTLSAEIVISATYPAVVAANNISATFVYVNEYTGNASVSWQQVAPYASFNVYRCTSMYGKYSLIASNVTALGYYDTGLQLNVTYYYRIQTVDSSGTVMSPPIPVQTYSKSTLNFTQPQTSDSTLNFTQLI